MSKSVKRSKREQNEENIDLPSSVTGLKTFYRASHTAEWSTSSAGNCKELKCVLRKNMTLETSWGIKIEAWLLGAEGVAHQGMSSISPENPNTQNAADVQGSRGIHTNEDWLRRWEEGTSDWVVTCVDPMLIKYESKIFEGRTKQQRVFVPLCGKTPDMKWFADKGHEVVGVELYATAIEQFFSERGIQYSSADLPNLNGKLYQSEDGMIKIYCCDLYLLSKDLLGQFDIIWDSRSVIAINVDDHTRYRDLLLSLLKPDGLYLLSTLDYDGSVFIGPPHPFSVERVQEFYGDFCNVSHLDTTETIQQRREKYKAKMAELEAAKHEIGFSDDTPLEIPKTSFFELVKSDYVNFLFFFVTLKL
ncbi:hypothetical protein CHS0354_005833 [Potamilus streckersoni]|uniref:thiopurine S-methyltransferase n=1 Tax=Potamilus streckersoni TaxID=2493646 RepID=A0AAE0VHE8_9BIVA|nr:hypothetical protein CHS0354_005833 [Potamilus streckersoni]